MSISMAMVMAGAAPSSALSAFTLLRESEGIEMSNHTNMLSTRRVRRNRDLLRGTITPGLFAASAASAALVAGLSQSAQAQNWVEAFKVFQPSSGPNRYFGQIVAIDGAFGVVGAAGFAPFYGQPGSATVFDLATGAPVSVLAAPGGGTANDEFAVALAMAGDRVVVGASNADNEQGVAYVFDRDSGAVLLTLTPAGNRFQVQQFGRAVDAYGDRVVVGARNDNVKGFGSGAAYLFDLNSGAQLLQLTASDGGVNHLFSADVALHGDTLAVGAPLANAGAVAQAGAVYVFDATTGTERFKVTDTSPAGGEIFGGESGWSALGLNDDYLVVGHGFDSEFGSNRGSVLIFDLATGALVTKVAPASTTFGNFGVNLDVESNRFAAVGRGFGGTAVFVHDIPSGAEQQVLQPSDRNDNEFGSGVGISDSHLLVGASWDADNGPFSGAAYIFDEGQLPPLELIVTGTCPGPMSGTVSNCTPNGDVVIFYGLGSATQLPPSAPCGGLIIDVGGPRFGYLTAVADANGNATNGRNAPRLVCGRVRVQALDIETCRLSNVITIN